MTIEPRQERDEMLSRMEEVIAFIGTDRYNQYDLHQMNARLRRLEDSFNEFRQQNRSVANEILGDAQRKALMDEFYAFEENYVDAIAKMNKRIEELTKAAAATAPVAVDPNADANANAAMVAAQQQGEQVFRLQMPFQAHAVVTTWPKFNGDFLNWSDFKERFMLGVHDVENMPETYKIAHLRNALTGEAAAAMSGFTLHGGNYAQLWDALVKKYERKYPMACAYLNKFFALPAMDPKETYAAELKALLNGTNHMLRQLRAMKYPVDRYDLVLVHALQQRLNKGCAKKWEKIRKDSDDPDNPTLVRMLEFLDEESTSQSNQSLAYKPLQVTISNPRAHQATSSSHRQPARDTDKVKYPCPICPEETTDHRVFDCPEFKPLTVGDRKRVVNQRKLCHNCLRKGHYKDECWDLHRCRSEECVRKGDVMHNSMLCPTKNRAEYVTTVRHERATSPTPYRQSRGRGRASPFKRRCDSGSS